MILKNVNNEVNNLVDLVMFIKMSKLDIPCIFFFFISLVRTSQCGRKSDGTLDSLQLDIFFSRLQRQE